MEHCNYCGVDFAPYNCTTYHTITRSHKICSGCVATGMYSCKKCGMRAHNLCVCCEIPVCSEHYCRLYKTSNESNVFKIAIVEICNDCEIYIAETKPIKMVIDTYQTTQLKEIRYVLTKLLEKYNVHDKLFINHLVSIQATLLHFDPDNLNFE